VFSWSSVPAAVLYRLEVRSADGDAVLSAVLQAGVVSYAAPPFVLSDHAGALLEWRVVVLNARGADIEETPWQRLVVEG
jgi:hypothetical protein